LFSVHRVNSEPGTGTGGEFVVPSDRSAALGSGFRRWRWALTCRLRTWCWLSALAPTAGPWLGLS